MESHEKQAEDIEMAAANRSYRAGFGVSEWEMFLTDDEFANLRRLAQEGHGTWGRERAAKGGRDE